MRAPRARWLAGLLALAASTRPGVLRAEPTAAEKALAEVLFQDARKLMDEGKIADACTKFAESQRIDPSLGTLLNLAVCHEKDGKTASAWAEFKEAAALAATAGKQDRADFASKRAADVEARLSRVTLDVAAPVPGMVITLNGRELSAAAAAGSGIPVDPGEAAIEASAPGKQAWSERVTVEPGPSDRQIVVPELREAAAAAPPPPPPKPPPPRPLPPPKPPARGGGALRTLGFVTGGVGVAGLGAGAVFGVMTLLKASDVEKACGDADGCSADDVAKNEDARTSAMISNVALGAGLAFAGAGVAMVLLSGPPREGGAARRLWLAPSVAARGASVSVEGLW